MVDVDTDTGGPSNDPSNILRLTQERNKETAYFNIGIS